MPQPRARGSGVGVLPRRLKLLSLAVAALLLLGCRATGNYPIDFLSEMHYGQAYRSQEPKRIGPPPESVPLAGAEVTLTAAQARELKNPLSASAANRAQAEELFRVNCQVCHGAKGDGVSLMKGVFEAATKTPPTDLTSAVVRSRTDGELYLATTNGVRDPRFEGDPYYVGMPPWRKLLTQEQRWLLVLHIRNLQR